tara:strand:- start:93 stop:344 length:252 start_codon:yes stop_codon:yes gene_type:complete
VTVISSYPNSEADTSGRHFCKVGELSRHGNRVPEGQKIDAYIYSQCGMKIRYGRCDHHAIVTMPNSETHMIGKEDMVDTCVDD